MKSSARNPEEPPVANEAREMVMKLSINPLLLKVVYFGKSTTA